MVNFFLALNLFLEAPFNILGQSHPKLTILLGQSHKLPIFSISLIQLVQNTYISEKTLYYLKFQNNYLTKWSVF